MSVMYRTKFSDCDNWVEMYHADKQSIIETMIDNLSADLKAGYNPTGLSIMRQLVELAEYKQEYGRESEQLSALLPQYAERRAFENLRRSGAID